MFIYTPTAGDIALSFENVISSRYYLLDDTIIVAVLTKPIYSAIERNALQNALTNQLEEEFEKKVIVSFDLCAYLLISDNMSEKDKQTLFEKVNYTPFPTN